VRVGFNARLLASPELRGWNRYAVNLLAELSSASAELVLYSDRPLHPSHLARLERGSYRVVATDRPPPYLYWEQVWLPGRCAKDRVDVLHTPFNFGVPWNAPCPRVLTLHDAIDPLYYWPREPWRVKLSRGALLSKLHHWVARTRADRVIAPSAHAMREIVQALGVDENRTHVIYEAADPNFRGEVGEADRRRVLGGLGLLGGSYFFYVGGWEDRKNLPFLVDAYARMARPGGPRLVLAGGSLAAPGEGRRLAELARERGVGEQVRLLGRVDEGDLPALYAGALAFVYPSRYEGFGLQLCEAMTLGAPVLAARAASLPEILGSGGDTFSPGDPGELVRLLTRVSGDAAYRDELAARARRRAKDFSWKRTALETIDVYRKALGR
jgi:hypothetical protein